MNKTFKIITTITDNKDLNILNSYLMYATHDHIVLKQDTMGRYYMHDLEYSKLLRNKADIVNILNAMWFNENVETEEEKESINKILKELGACEI